MATVEAPQELRGEVTNEFQKRVIRQEGHRVKIHNVVESQTKADQAGQEYQRWKIDTEGRMLRHDNQQATLGSTLSELVARFEKLENNGVGQFGRCRSSKRPLAAYEA